MLLHTRAVASIALVSDSEALSLRAGVILPTLSHRVSEPPSEPGIIMMP
jgi:hypothetical protein